MTLKGRRRTPLAGSAKSATSFGAILRKMSSRTDSISSRLVVSLS